LAGVETLASMNAFVASSELGIFELRRQLDAVLQQINASCVDLVFEWRSERAIGLDVPQRL